MGVGPGGIVALPVLALLALGACGGGSDPLTTRDYTDSLEEAHASMEERLVENTKAYEDFPEEIEGRLDALDSPWSAEDAESVKEIEEDVLQALSDVLQGVLTVFEEYHRVVSALEPPEHLSDLHNAMTESLKQFLLKGEELVEALQDRETPGEEEREDFSSQGSHAGEACQELRATLEEELGRDVAICD